MELRALNWDVKKPAVQTLGLFDSDGDNKSFWERYISERSDWIVVKGYDTSLPRDEIIKTLTHHFSSCGRVGCVNVSVEDRCAHLEIFGDRVEYKASELDGSDLGGFKLVVTPYWKLVTNEGAPFGTPPLMTPEVQKALSEKEGNLVEKAEKRREEWRMELSQGLDDSTPLDEVVVPREEIDAMVMEKIEVRKDRRPGLGKLVTADGKRAGLLPRNPKLEKEIETLRRALEKRNAEFDALKDDFAKTKEDLAETQTTVRKLMDYLKKKDTNFLL